MIAVSPGWSWLVSTAKKGEVSPQKPACSLGSAPLSFEIITKTLPVMGFAWTAAGKEISKRSCSAAGTVTAQASKASPNRTATGNLLSKHFQKEVIFANCIFLPLNRMNRDAMHPPNKVHKLRH